MRAGKEVYRHETADTYECALSSRVRRLDHGLEKRTFACAYVSKILLRLPEMLNPPDFTRRSFERPELLKSLTEQEPLNARRS